MGTHNICFYGELEKIILELSSNTPPYQVPCIIVQRSKWCCHAAFQQMTLLSKLGAAEIIIT